MMLGKITATVVSTIKNDKYKGTKIFVIQPIDPYGKNKGDTILAAEYENNAGIGDTILYFTKGNASRLVVKDSTAPIDYAIAGVVDRIDMY